MSAGFDHEDHGRRPAGGEIPRSRLGPQAGSQLLRAMAVWAAAPAAARPAPLSRRWSPFAARPTWCSARRQRGRPQRGRDRDRRVEPQRGWTAARSEREARGKECHHLQRQGDRWQRPGRGQLPKHGHRVHGQGAVLCGPVPNSLPNFGSADLILDRRRRLTGARRRRTVGMGFGIAGFRGYRLTGRNLLPMMEHAALPGFRSPVTG
jgi:hypothetical protein